MPEVKGVILENDKPKAGVKVRTVHLDKNSDSRTTESDTDGSFKFDLPNGKWKICVSCQENDCTSIVFEVNNQNVNLENICSKCCKPSKRHDFIEGICSFGILIALLVLLIIAYVSAHRVPIAKNQSVVILDLIEKAGKRIVKEPPPTTKRVVAFKNDAEFMATILQIRQNWDVLVAQNKNLVANVESQIKKVFESLDQEIQADDPDKNSKLNEVETSLKILKSYIEPYNQNYFWETEPYRSLEVIYWGLAGVLVNLIVTVGSYMRFERFYKEGIFQHVAQIVSLPLMALVFVFLVSQAQLVITIPSAGDVKLGLTDPKILAAISFLIGAQFWALWNILRTFGDQFIGQSKA